MNQTEELIAKRLLLNSLHPSRYIRWAVDMLMKNISTESIQILAGLGENEETKVVEKYFSQSLSEINFTLDDCGILNKYSLKIAHDVLSKKIKPKDGLKMMIDIYFTIENESLYCFLEIDEFHNHLDSTIIEEFRIFLRYKELNITADLWNICYCKNCKRLTQYNYLLNKCSECNSKEIFSYHNQDGRKIILNYIESHHTSDE
ncbi:MAG: hypothetical protein K0R77_1091 [Chryseobacterium sp.]|jgi:hypothetical protein|uniref:hypothetical protein n=1 Tax=Chryseobacterium sp. TaxID=1871047 RepID=UPI00262BFB61|nr:hypothetical protein [Chryseobacterium sp.]MDF2551816.1 hypothetical protein [Chryseobacterium sp.]